MAVGKAERRPAAVRRRVTSIDVARSAGVSQSAVSRAFTPGAIIAEDTREKVFTAARHLGYAPNALARSLITQRSNLIGVVIADVANPFYSKMLSAFSTRLSALGLHVLLFTVAEEGDLARALAEMQQYRVDGVIVTSVFLSQELAQGCRRQGTPVILFNRYVSGPGVASVRVENYEGGRMVANLLLDAGHRRIAFVSGSPDRATNFDREAGFIGRLEERGTPLHRRAQGDYTFESGHAAALALFGGGEPPDAMFCASDLMALGALEAVRYRFGLRVPEDVSIVGFDDIPAAAWPSYSLTTISQPIEAMTAIAVEMLMAEIVDPEQAASTRLVPGELILRRSARLPPSVTESASRAPD